MNLKRFNPNKRKASDGEISAQSNDEKADEALRILGEYNTALALQHDLESVIVDALTDIFHLAHRERLLPQALIDAALTHWEAES